MDKYSTEELEQIIRQYECSQKKTKPQKTTTPKIVPKVLCEICGVEIKKTGIKAHQKTNRHMLLADIHLTSQELKKQLEQVHEIALPV